MQIINKLIVNVEIIIAAADRLHSCSYGGERLNLSHSHMTDVGCLLACSKQLHKTIVLYLGVYFSFTFHSSKLNAGRCGEFKKEF